MKILGPQNKFSRQDQNSSDKLHNTYIAYMYNMHVCTTLVEILVVEPFVDFLSVQDLDFSWDTKIGRYYDYFTSGVACSEVEVDVLTGGHHIISTDIIMDVGDSLNPALDIGQVYSYTVYVNSYLLLVVFWIRLKEPLLKALGCIQWKN